MGSRAVQYSTLHRFHGFVAFGTTKTDEPVRWFQAHLIDKLSKGVGEVDVN